MNLRYHRVFTLSNSTQHTAHSTQLNTPPACVCVCLCVQTGVIKSDGRWVCYVFVFVMWIPHVYVCTVKKSPIYKTLLHRHLPHEISFSLTHSRIRFRSRVHSVYKYSIVACVWVCASVRCSNGMHMCCVWVYACRAVRVPCLHIPSSYLCHKFDLIPIGLKSSLWTPLHM